MAAVQPSASPHAHRRRRRSLFLRILIVVTAVMHLPVAVGMGELARRLALPQPRMLGALWGFFGVVLFLGRARASMTDQRRNGLLVRLVDVPYFIHWCAAVWTLIPALVETLALPVVDLARGLPVTVPASAYMWTYLSGLLISAYGVLVRRRWFRVVEREIPIVGLGRAFDGLRIAQLSDLHIGTLTPKHWGLRWTRAANRLAPDVAVVTGDLVTSGNAYHDDVAEVVGSLRAHRGVFVSMGNHDYFGEEEGLVAALRGKGVTVLRNEGVALEGDGQRLWLAAIDDTWTRRDDIESALAGRDGAPAVLLAHDPERFDAAADAGASLVLSGHTHGGQVAIPFVSRAWNLARLGHRYVVGLYQRGSATLHVHPGLGTTGPPVRLGVAPEVTILVLRSA
jgi:uncharacterized protein